MLRSRHFNNDNRIGKIGEDSLRMKLNALRLKGSIQLFVDNTTDPKSQREDVDFTVVKLDGNSVKYECKTDCYGLNSRNVSYEVTSHDFAGCLGRSNSDYIYYVFVTDKEEVSESYSIELQKWREWIGLNYSSIKPYVKNSGEKLQLFYSKDIGVLQFLCNIDEMVKDGVAKRF